MKKIKVLFVLPNLNAGGAERILTTVMNDFVKHGFEVHLLLVNRDGNLLPLLSDKITIHALNGRFVLNLRPFVKKVNEISPDVVFSGVAGFNAVVSFLARFFDKKIRLVARETSMISRNISKKSQRFFYRHTFNRYDAVIAQGQTMKDDLVRETNLRPEKIKVIFNPYTRATQKQTEKPRNTGPQFSIINVGRLVPMKGQSKILDFVARQSDKNIHLYLLGQGPDAAHLLEQAEELGIAEQVHLVGHVDDPTPHLLKSDLYVMSSDYEGFPNAVIEALWNGVPVLANDCPGGIREVIKVGINGEIANIDHHEAFDKAFQRMKSQIHRYDSAKIRAETHHLYSLEHALASYRETIRGLVS